MQLWLQEKMSLQAQELISKTEGIQNLYRFELSPLCHIANLLVPLRFYLAYPPLSQTHFHASHGERSKKTLG